MTRYRYGADPKYGLLLWLCLPIVLVYAAGKVALAWLKTKLPSAETFDRHCQECGWVLRLTATSLLCDACQDHQEWQLADASKLFCCDVDLRYLERRTQSGVGGWVATTGYCCPICGRVWLYIDEWHKDSGREADWYPQQTEIEFGDTLPPLFDERTRTKVYEVKA